jgi:hypothetical protein
MTIISSHQRGSNLELIASKIFKDQGFELSAQFKAPVNAGRGEKMRSFDLGSSEILVECKSCTWTGTGNSPSAKLDSFVKAMARFQNTPPVKRKILFVLRSVHPTKGTLGAYFIKTHLDCIPPDVEIWEYDSVSGKTAIILTISVAGVSDVSQH